MNSKIANLFVLVSFLVFPMFALAQGYKPLVGIPGITDPGLNFGDYINALYALSISVAALLAVIKIVIAGMKYMLSDVVTSKSEAISDIQGSVFGLIIVISAVLILTVINPNLTKTEIFLDTVASTPNSPAAPPGAGITNGTGYKYAKVGEIPTFKADCIAVSGSIYMTASLKGSAVEVCYAPLPVATVTMVDALYNVVADDAGNLSYPGADRAAVLKRFQTSIYPRLMGATGALEAELGAQVLLGIVVQQPGDFVDVVNTGGAFVATCNEINRAKGPGVTYRTTYENPSDWYNLACAK